MKTVVLRLESEGRNGTAYVYKSVFNAMSRYWRQRQKGAMKLDRIFTPAILQGFEMYLLENGLSMSTVSTYKKALRTIYYIAVEEKRLKKWKQGMFATQCICVQAGTKSAYRLSFSPASQDRLNNDSHGIKEEYQHYKIAPKNVDRKLIQIIQKLTYNDRFLPYSIPYAKKKIHLTNKYFIDRVMI